MSRLTCVWLGEQIPGRPTAAVGSFPYEHDTLGDLGFPLPRKLLKPEGDKSHLRSGDGVEVRLTHIRSDIA